MRALGGHMAIRDVHPKKGEAGFAWRGREPTRVEALSDMVFAFAVTLLVVSADPPASFDDLISQLWGFPGFAAAFAILLVIWNAHYIFFRRYALTDTWTTFLNAILLFLILFFVYPLKYLATMLSAFVQTLIAGSASAPMSSFEGRQALLVMAVAYAAVFFTFAALYGHALRRAKSLELNDHEVRMTRFSLWQQIIHAGVALLVVAGAAQTYWWAPLSGFLFFLVGPFIFLAAAITLRVPRTKRSATAETAD
jgi:uncharacterized membrane protein